VEALGSADVRRDISGIGINAVANDDGVGVVVNCCQRCIERSIDALLV
jgi:hypothetical protein